MKLDPGYYKVKRRGNFLIEEHTHYLRVFYKDKKKYIQMDHGGPELAEDHEDYVMEGYILVKKITRPIEIRHLEVAISWSDEDGDRFKMKARNIHVLNKIFKDFPRLLKALKKE